MKNRVTGKLRSIRNAPIVNKLGKALRKLPILDAITFWVGIWDTINGVKKIKEGFRHANEWKKHIRTLRDAKQNIVEWYAQSDL